MQKKKKNTLFEKLSTRFHILLVNEKTLEKKKLISSSTSSILITAVFVFGLMAIRAEIAKREMNKEWFKKIIIKND